MDQSNRIGYFGGANAAGGFRSFFDDLTADLNYLYVLKGGPGTGKSTFLKRAAEEAAARGHRAEFIYCASDCGSLDGVIFPSSGVGIVDGTAPHFADPALPGINGEWIPLDRFLDPGKLKASAETVVSLKERKKKYYANAASACSLFALAEREKRKEWENALDREKMEAAAARIVKKIGIGGGYSFRPMQITSVGMRGFTRLPTMTENAAHVIPVTGTAAYAFLTALGVAARRNGLPTVGSLHPITQDAMTDLWFPDAGWLFTSRVEPFEEEAEKRGVRINMDRFLKKDVMKCGKNYLKLMQSVTERARKTFGDAFDRISECHFAMERIYAGGMDFSAKEEEERKKIGEIVSRLG